MASLYELLCHHSFTCSDPLLEDLFPNSLIDFLRIFLNLSQMKFPMMTQSDRSTTQFLHFTLLIPGTFQKYSYTFHTFMQLQDFYHN